jgi:small subunit ribosomal protein S18
MSEDTPTTDPGRDRPREDRGDRDSGGGGGGHFGGGGGGGRFGGRDGGREGGGRFGRDRRDGPPQHQTVKSRLRAKARKKARKAQKKLFTRKKVSRFTTDRKLEINYKDAKMLRGFLTETGKIIPRRISGNTASQQRKLALSVKRARHIALLPYTDSHQ